MARTIEISHRTILFVIGVLFGGWLILQIRDILYLLFISFILMTSLRPLVERLVRFKIPRVFAILLIYLILIASISIVVGSVIPTVVSQSTGLLQDLPAYINEVVPSLNIDFRAITQEIAPLTQNLVKVGVEIFNNIISVVTVLVFTFYFLLARDNLKQTLKTFMPDEHADRVYQIINDVEERLGAWARGQITLMLIIGFSVYIGLTILQVKYALPLAVFAGLLEIVPMIGAIVGAVPAILVAFIQAPLLALSVAALFFVIQQFENHLVVPLIMRKAVGLSPIVTIIAFMVGARFGGIIGAVLAIPAILVIQVIMSHVIKFRQNNETSS